LPHKTRSFSTLPQPEHAQTLLAELSTATCSFAPAAADAPLALYGAGDLGLLARDFLNYVGREPVMVIDRNAHSLAQDTKWSGTQLLTPHEAAKSAKESIRVAVSIVTDPYVPIERSLSNLGFTDIVPFYDLTESFRQHHPLSNGWFAAPLSREQQAKTAKVLALWDDDISRAHHLQFIAWHRLREEWTFDPAPLSLSNRFFIPEIVSVLHKEEVFLDAGAHHGIVINAFLDHTEGRFRRVVAIEPDAINRKRLAENVQKLLPGDQRVTIHDFALSDRDGEALFHTGLDYASQLSRTGRTWITTRRLDTLGLFPTFIKLHLEGAELATLTGAKQILRGSRPIIVATVYHNEDGIWKTAQWLMNTLSDYRFLFRSHSWCGTGAVIYAIPERRE
jgi:FkbM family methyltransferase